MPPCHFSPPWTIDDNGACFLVRDHNEQALAFSSFTSLYFEGEAGRRTAAGLLTRDEARRIDTRAGMPVLRFAPDRQAAVAAEAATVEVVSSRYRFGRLPL